jgi:hypothetical protein
VHSRHLSANCRNDIKKADKRIEVNILKDPAHTLASDVKLLVVFIAFIIVDYQKLVFFHMTKT